MSQPGQMMFDFPPPEPTASLPMISPFNELGAYEELWLAKKASFKSLAEKIAKGGGSLPSDLVDAEISQNKAEKALQKLQSGGGGPFGVRVHGAAEYPAKLRDARHPAELLYYRGDWHLIYSHCVSVVGTRNPTPEGEELTRELVTNLVADDYTIVSGLARGIDSIAHKTAIEQGGNTIAVIGTPLSHAYPRENQSLQNEIARRFLLISQVPVLRYESQDYRYNRRFFPERNKTMSALTEATIIIEAGETSGTLVQARAALDQKRRLLVLENCFRNRFLTWPEKFERKGAIRVSSYRDVKRALSE